VSSVPGALSILRSSCGMVMLCRLFRSLSFLFFSFPLTSLSLFPTHTLLPFSSPTLFLSFCPFFFPPLTLPFPRLAHPSRNSSLPFPSKGRRRTRPECACVCVQSKCPSTTRPSPRSLNRRLLPSLKSPIPKSLPSPKSRLHLRLRRRSTTLHNSMHIRPSLS